MTIRLPPYVRAIEIEDIGTTRHVRIVWRSPIRILQALRTAALARLRHLYETGGM